MHRFALLVAVLAVLLGASLPASAQTATAIAVDGDALTRIVTTTRTDVPLMAAGTAGLYRLDADSWSRIADAPPAGQIVSDGSDPGLLLAGDSASCMAGGPPVDLQRSGDGGHTWTVVSNAIGIRPLAIWNASALALGASCSGIHLSTDQGQTWAVMPGVDPGWDVTSFADVSGAGEGPIVLVGLTGEGGTSSVHRIDLSDPAAPLVSGPLREYFGIGGLAGAGDTWLLAAMDGAWITTDAGVTWTRSSDGLEGIVLERDPLVDGLPQDLDPNQVGLYSALLLPGTSDGFVAGSADGLYMKPAGDSTWAKVDGTAGKIDQVVAGLSGECAYLVDGQVMLATLP